MHILNTVQSYLLDTRQIDALAIRQARMFCRSMTDDDLKEKTRILLLLNLAALAQGSPRITKEYVIKRFLDSRIIRQFAAAYASDHDTSRPAWESELLLPGNMAIIENAFDELIVNPGHFSPIAGPPPAGPHDPAPLLVVRDGYMGFAKYRQAAFTLETNLRDHLARSAESGRDSKATVTDSGTAEVLKEVFAPGTVLDKGRLFHYRQIAAAALALRTKFLIVSGGPGTGKTSMVIQILRVLLRFYSSISADRIVLCAPTGRAKARLGESIDEALHMLERNCAGISQKDSALKDIRCRTLYSLLGFRSDGTPKYSRSNPLPWKVIVVDEASMVDLYLFHALIDAALPDCRIILVGDMHQLPSVEAGALLGDLTARFSSAPFPTLTDKTARWIDTSIQGIQCDGGDERSRMPVIADNDATIKAGLLIDTAIILTHSYRSKQEILQISECINNGKTSEEWGRQSENCVSIIREPGNKPVELWLSGYFGDTQLAPVRNLKNLPLTAWDNLNGPEYSPVIEQAFRIYDNARILTLTHEGSRGRIAINGVAERMLRPLLDDGNRETYFHGQAVMLTANRHELDLYNGDTGIVMRSVNGDKVIFRRGRKFLAYSIDRLTGLEPAFAVTVHKAQGSEYNNVLFVLPEQTTPLLTRQIIYTAVTRAKESIRILDCKELLNIAVTNIDERAGGIRL